MKKMPLLNLIFICAVMFVCLGADSREPMWRFVTGGRIRSAPAIGRDAHLYFISDDRYLYSLTAGGEQRWRYYLEDRLTDCFAVSFDGTIYIGYKSGILSAVHGYGQKIWEFRTDETIRRAPAISSDGTILLTSEEGTLFAISHTGSLRWKLTLPAAAGAAPVVDVDHMTYLPLTDGTLAAVTPWGELKWILRLTGIPQSPSIGGDGRLYVGTSAGILYALSGLPKIEWSITIGGALSTPIIGPGDTVYIASKLGLLVSLTAAGDICWSLALDGPPSGPCVLGQYGTIFIATGASTFSAIDSQGHVKWNLPAKGIPTDLILSSREILYAGSDDWAVYAFQAEKPADAPWPMDRHDAFRTGRSRRTFNSPSIDELYRNDPDYIYFRALLLSGNPELMSRALQEIRLLYEEKRVTKSKPFLLYLLRKIAGFTVIEEDKSVNFPLRGYSTIRRDACLLYSEIGALDAFPLLLSILEKDEDFTIKTVAVRCLSFLQSDPDQSAERVMAGLLTANGRGKPDNLFARETVTALDRIASYHGALSDEGIRALISVSRGPYQAEVRNLAKATIQRLVGWEEPESGNN